MFIASRFIYIFHPSSFIHYSLRVQFQKITIVGVGLLGGSIGLAAKRRRLAREVAGYVRRPASLKDCEKAGAVDYATTDLPAAVSNADLVILCTPLAQMHLLVERFLPALKRGAIVTDVGSVKAGVVHEVCGLVRKSGAHFIGSHPMAGGEEMGVLAAKADLFVNAICVVTPTKNSDPRALRKVEQFWKSLGGRTLRLAPQLHDQMVGRSSHLPHVVAAALATQVLNPKSAGQQAALCANGFRDTTRIASGSPEMWRDIVLANRKNLSRSLDAFVVELQKFQRVLRTSNARAISKYFETAKIRRDHWHQQILNDEF
ncbi:MAG TPA: prephenate dehydrogenase/arogenate dehydrogenase family protein [Verrucomicrobiae bacterium]|nr:prephenate dehydrogenase/arogenate dehydrogenase family protein [Verrucomicrobiae bacterium]